MGLSGLFRLVAAGAVACAAVFAPSTAMACGGDGDVVVHPVISFPQQNQNAQALLTAAADLDVRASSLESQAVSFTQRASEANIDARAIRVQAATTESTTERTQLLQLANQLSTQASLEASTANDLRRQATAFRDEARLDRLRATQLVNASSGGWHRRPVPSGSARI